MSRYDFLLEGEEAPKTRGRPRGKRSDPDYTQVTVYLPKTLHRGVRSKLTLQGREFSQLVEELLAGWEKSEEARSES